MGTSQSSSHKYGRDRMSRLTFSRNVQWSEECATKWAYPRAQDLVNLSSLRSGYFDGRTKKMNKKNLRKRKKCIFGRNPKASYFMTETLMVEKLAYIVASLCEGDLFSYLFSVLTKISYNLGKKLDKTQTFFSSLKLPKKSRAKNFDNSFSLRRSLHNPRTVYETMNSVFGLGHKI